jgi:Ca2+-binding EF-hand superfamily protein
MKAIGKWILCAVIGLGAWAQAAEARPPACKQWDKNRDGQVKLLEMQTALREQFLKADANKDGFVTADEILQLMPFFVRDKAHPGVQTYIRTQDNNGDGKITLEEVMQAAKKRFAALDNNQDGALSESECQKAEAPEK